MENSNNRRDRKAGTAEELGCAGNAGEIDDSLQIRCPSRAELPGQVLPAYAEAFGQCSGPDGLLDFSDQDVPRGPLQRLGEAEHSWRIGQGSSPLCRDRCSQHQISYHSIIHSLNRHSTYAAPAARQQKLTVVRSEWRIGNQWNSWQACAEI
jgi:hypothetical protein